MSIILEEEQLLKIGRVYGSDDEKEEESEDVDGEPGALDDDILSGVGLDEGLFEDDDDAEDDPFSSDNKSDDEEE